MAWFDSTYFNPQQPPRIYDTGQDAPLVTPATPAQERHWVHDLMDLLQGMSSRKPAQGGGAPVGVSGGEQLMPYLPPSGKGGSFDIVKLAMAVAGGVGGAGAIGGGSGGAPSAIGAAAGQGGAGGVTSASPGMGGGGAASSPLGSGSGASGFQQALSLYNQFGGMLGGGGGGGGKSPTPSAPPMRMAQLPYQTIQTESPGPVFGERLMPSTLDFFQARQQNNLFPRNPYG